MEEQDQQQKELFEFEKPRKQFPGLRGLFPKADFEGRVLVTLTPEQIILMAIAVVLALVVIYAVGVEQGRSRNVELPAAVTVRAGREPKKSQSFFSTTQVMPQASSAQARPALKPSPVREQTSPVAAGYTIVAAAYRSPDSAAQALNILRREGLAAYLFKKDVYSLVCVGAYADREGDRIKADLVKVRARYKDAYIKSR